MIVTETTTGQKFTSDFGPGGLRVLTPILEPFQRPTAFDRLRESHRELSRDVKAMRLLHDIRRVLPYSPNPEERKALLQAEVLLSKSPRSVSEKFLLNMTAAIAGKLRSLPAERRSVGFNAQTRASSERVISFIVSDESVIDRHGTILKVSGLSTDTYMTRNPVVGWAHNLYGGFFSTPDPEHIIGRTLRLRKAGSKLEADVEFLPESVNPTAERIYQMIRRKALNSTSIGFIPKKVTTTVIDGREVPVIEESELLEISVVAIPSNPAVDVTSGRSRMSA
jgi:HK97 family phage prohead protease